MIDSRASELIKQGDFLFGKKTTLLSLWQEIAENFYPERADFTICRSLGAEFAEHLMTSYPTLARRELGDAFATMLRNGKWFNLTVGENSPNQQAKVWLEWARDIQYRAMYDKRTQLVKATKQGDHDYAAFGQCAISVELNRNADGLLYRCWHLRDIAWCENTDGAIDTVHRKWKPTARDLKRFFRNKISKEVNSVLDREPYKEINCQHIVIPAEDYDTGKRFNAPYVSVFIDVDNQHVMEEIPSFDRIYCIPRWQTVSGSQYAYSPATIVALPDAKLIQSITRVLLEAGEKAVDPPMVASREVFQDDFNLMAGGITWADIALDTDIRNVIAEFGKSTSLPTGINIRDDVREVIHQAFYLNSLTLPNTSGMTAYEVSQRVQEYIRQATPLFAPMEPEYNGDLCEMTFNKLMRAGAFGSVYDIPQSLQGEDVQFTFESPLQAALGQEKQGQSQAVAQILLGAAQLEQAPGAVNVDINRMIRDTISGSGAPAKWLRSEDEVTQIMQPQQEAQQQAAEVAQLQQGAQTVNEMANAAQSVQSLAGAA